MLPLWCNRWLCCRPLAVVRPARTSATPSTRGSGGDTVRGNLNLKGNVWHALCLSLPLDSLSVPPTRPALAQVCSCPCHLFLCLCMSVCAVYVPTPQQQ